MPADPARTLQTPAGDVALAEYRLRLAGREWGVLHTAAVLSFEDEQRFLSEPRERQPYGVALWPASIAMAHELAARGEALAGRRVLELGAGTGLPGIVAAAFGAHVVQTDRHALALDVCRRNGERNGVGGRVEYRLADWTAWSGTERYDLVLGADVIYGESAHEALRHILAASLAPGGRVLLADPFRPISFRLLEALEADGWAVSMSKWSVGEARAPRAIGVFELAAPGAGGGPPE
jgi:predicted nicotinamide N-methyase